MAHFRIGNAATDIAAAANISPDEAQGLVDADQQENASDFNADESAIAPALKPTPKPAPAPAGGFPWVLVALGTAVGVGIEVAIHAWRKRK